MRDWWVVVPVRDTRVGKSRLTLPVPIRRALAGAMLRDTVRAVRATATVAGVVVVCATRRDAALIVDPADDPPGGAPVLPLVERHPGGGLNAAVAIGARFARRIAPSCRLASLPADLPALDGPALAAALTLASGHARAFSPDAAGTGTTLLTAAPGQRLRPRYGPGSSDRHRTDGAVDLDLAADHPVRHDVDDLAALHRALARGAGPWTVRAADAHPRDGGERCQQLRFT